MQQSPVHSADASLRQARNALLDQARIIARISRAGSFLLGVLAHSRNARSTAFLPRAPVQSKRRFFSPNMHGTLSSLLCSITPTKSTRATQRKGFQCNWCRRTSLNRKTEQAFPNFWSSSWLTASKCPTRTWRRRKSQEANPEVGTAHEIAGLPKDSLTSRERSFEPIEISSRVNLFPYGVFALTEHLQFKTRSTRGVTVRCKCQT